MSMESDDVGACSSTSEISEDFSVPGTSQSWRSQSLPRFPSDLGAGLQIVHKHRWVPSKYKERLLRLDTQAQKISRRRKPVRIQHKLKQDNNDPTFPQRTITTIDEEKVVVWHSCEKRSSSREMRIHSSTSEFGKLRTTKFYKESEDMKRIVNKLKKMAETKPEMLKDTLPDETIKLFKSIHIK